MAVNVTEKDKTLNEIIDWCEQLAAEGMRLASALLMQHDMDAYGVVRGQVNAYEKTADHCRSLLGYSGNMPTAKVSDKALELLASSKLDETEQTENSKQDAVHEIDTSEYPFIRLEADELVRMICDAYQTGVFSGKEQS